MDFFHVASVGGGVKTAHKLWEDTYVHQFERFLTAYERPPRAEDDGPPASYSKYEQQAAEVLQDGRQGLRIRMSDILDFENGDDLGDFIRKYYLELKSAIDHAVGSFIRSVSQKSAALHQSGLTAAGAPTTTTTRGAATYRAYIVGAPFIHSVRSLRCENLGQIVCLRGTVTRTSDVRPELKTASFECGTCATIIENLEQQFKYTSPTICPFRGCGNRTNWYLRVESCKFEDWQKLRLQENASEIPAGSMPRSIDVIVNGDNCEQCKPGDRLLLTGCLAAVPDVPSLMRPSDVPKTIARERMLKDRQESTMVDNSVKALRRLGVRDLGYRLLFMATDVAVTNSTDDGPQSMSHLQHLKEDAGPTGVPTDPAEYMSFLGFDAETQQKFLRVASLPDATSVLARCIATEIHGFEEVKKALLMMLVGGVEKRTAKDEIKLRGDINVCIVGDPGTAKSQLLKFVQAFSGRAIYTAGKSCTAAGLTASVHRDPDQGDSVIEAGALMLADRGICCIDEFDKMDDKDMVAIHEAMEQQTISIAKAGIQATLNARASVLAACNPRGGRYDRSKTFRQNIRLTAPIMSRFDLFFALLDDTDKDEIVARHIVNMHATGEPIDLSSTLTGVDERPVLGIDEMKQYVRVARNLAPQLGEKARLLLIRSYGALRHESFSNARSLRITVRQLESMIRLSEAIAKLRLSHEVTALHVEEAHRLFLSSLSRVEKGQVALISDAPQEECDPSTEDVAAVRPVVIRIDAEEFDKIASLLISRLRTIEMDLAQEEGVDGSQGPLDVQISKDELIAWYLDNYTSVQTMEAVQAETEKISRVIGRMAAHDFTLIEETKELEMCGDEDGSVALHKGTFVRLHPNYAGSATYSSIATDHKATHASLDSEFYAQTGAEENGGAGSAVLEDSDLVDYMYGDDISFFENEGA